ncbi:MAG: HAD family hydrolase [Chloroflexi bacterium]|nr:HAD family hydrolase [Chloroflexota bacterium]
MTASLNGLIVFDLDNTVVHSRIDFAGLRRAIIAALRDARVPIGRDEELMRLSIGQIIAIGEAEDGDTGRRLGAEAWRLVLEYERAGMRQATVEPEAARTLGALRDSGFLLVVLTNNARLATLDALEKFELSAAFDMILTRDEVAMKPEPEGIERARAHFGPRAARTVMVGDSWLDGTAAQRAGVPFIAFRPKPEALEQRGVPVWVVVERLDQIATVVDGSWPTLRPPS